MIPTLGIARRLSIFVDESGTMPTPPDPKAFVVAALGTCSPISQISHLSLNARALGPIMVKAGVAGAVTFLRPTAAEMTLLRSKWNAMDAAASATRLSSGSNAAFVSEHGIAWPNFVWSVACETAIVGCIYDHLRVGAIHSVEIIADRKTLSRESAALFDLGLQQAKGRLMSVLERGYKKLLPEAWPLLKSRARFGSDDITLTFADSDMPDYQATGLLLAHHVAKQSLLNRPGMFELMSQQNPATAQPTLHALDILPILLAPVASDVVEVWERKHGRRFSELTDADKSNQS